MVQNTSSRKWFVLVWLLTLAVTATGAVFLATAAVPTLATAQDADGDDFEAEPAPAADPGGAAPAADPGGAAPAGNEPAPEPKSYLVWAFEALGWGYSLIFLSLSFTLVALFVMNLLTARRENVVPIGLVQGFESHLDEKRYQEAFEVAKNDQSFLGQVLAAGLAKLSAGYQQAVEAMQEVGEEESMKMEHRLSYMALIGTISPMIGLFGTVHGMISSFSVIAVTTSQPKPAELAQGISTALFTTLIGLFIAIPAVAAYNILRNRTSRLVLEVGIISEGLMSRFENMGGGKKS